MASLVDDRNEQIGRDPQPRVSKTAVYFGGQGNGGGAGSNDASGMAVASKGNGRTLSIPVCQVPLGMLRVSTPNERIVFRGVPDTAEQWQLR